MKVPGADILPFLADNHPELSWKCTFFVRYAQLFRGRVYRPHENVGENFSIPWKYIYPWKDHYHRFRAFPYWANPSIPVLCQSVISTRCKSARSYTPAGSFSPGDSFFYLQCSNLAQLFDMLEKFSLSRVTHRAGSSFDQDLQVAGSFRHSETKYLCRMKCSFILGVSLLLWLA